jgi:FecR protein
MMSNARALSLCSLAFLLCGTAALAQAPATPDPETDATTSANPETSTAAPAASPDARTEVLPAAHTGVRIVRLSEVNGTVLMDRGNAQAFEPAFANLPIVQGARLRTDDGTAEVEFEDGSSLRLTPHTLVDFPVLTAQRAGTRATTVHVEQGSIYASLVKAKPSNLTLAFHDRTLALGPAAHIVLTVSPGTPRLDVLDGTVQATRGATTQLVTKKKALVFDPANDTPTLVSSKREEGPFDAWDKRSVEYHNSFANRGQFSNSSYQYGLADLNYYGSFLGGSCSGMWRPYLASSNWSPYGYGVWALYPGAGYSWVSPYPWGWAPYHSGSWGFCPGTGWAWSPGNQWNGLDNLSVANGARLQRFGNGQPVRPPHPPSPQGNKTLMVVSEQPPVASGANDKTDKFLFRANSAGLGVPRGVFGKLNGISNSTLQHGTAERPVHVAVSPTSVGAAGQRQPGAMSRNVSAAPNHTSPTGMSAARGNSVSNAHTGGMGGGQMGGGTMGGASHGAPSGHH